MIIDSLCKTFKQFICFRMVVVFNNLIFSSMLFHHTFNAGWYLIKKGHGVSAWYFEYLFTKQKNCLFVNRLNK